MPVDVIMPQMGETVAEGTILRWLVHEGDRVGKEQPIVEISTDKIDTEVPSPVNGVLKKILYPEGKTLPVQTIIAQIEEVEVKKGVGANGRSPVLEFAKQVEITKVAKEEIIFEKPDETQKRHSPLVRRLAKEYNINLEEVKGTGEGGRVTKKDIMDYVASKPGISAPPTAETEKKVLERETLIPVSPKRKITADRMVQSKRTAVHVTTVFEVDMSKIERYRELNKENLKREGIHITYLPFITYATARDITRQKQVDSELKNERFISGIIMDTFPGTFAMIRQKGGTPRWNKNLEIVTGYTGEEISTMTNEQALEWFYTKDNAPKVIEAMQKTFSEGSVQLEVEHLINRGRSHSTYLFNAARIELDKELYLVVWGLDISKIKKAEADIKKEKEKVELLAKDLEKFKLAVDSESDHVMITDKDGAILYVNKAGEEITGYMAKEIIGKNAGDLWGGNMSKEYYEKLWAVIDHMQKKPFVGEIINHRKNGQSYTAEIRIAPVLDESGNVQFFVGVERDITKLKEAEQMKTDFISFASHQLRTPLTAIRWNTEMLRDTKLGELTVEQKKYLSEIENGEKRMADLIKSLLNISRLEAQKIKIEPKPTDIASLISSVVSEFTPVTNTRNCVILFNKPSQPSTLIDVDPVLLKQVILNLLNNAIHYSKPRKCKVEISFKEIGGHCQIDVVDEGIGIPSEAQSRVFSKFFRAENAIKVSTEGIGLGLYIVKLIIETSGGKVWFESTEGKGSVFHVAIPISGMKRVAGEKELSI